MYQQQLQYMMPRKPRRAAVKLCITVCLLYITQYIDWPVL